MLGALQGKINGIVSLPESEFEYFLPKVKIQHLQKDRNLLENGDVCNFIAYVGKGTLRTYLLNDSKEINTEFFTEGSFAGAFTSFVLAQKTALTIQAVE